MKTLATLEASARLKLAALFTFMVISLESWRSIPFLKPWGVDLHNLHIFQKCAHGATPYPIDARTCGDLFARPMIYPPVMYRSFFWLRWMELEPAMYIWSAVLVVAFAAVLWAWARLVPRERGPLDVAATVAFGALLLFQFPFVFSLERGSTDIGSVLFWTMSAYFFERRKLVFAGLAAGVATSYKLYPLFPCLVITLGLAIAYYRTRAFHKLDFIRFGAGAAASFLLLNALCPDAPYYFLTVLPRFAKDLTDGAIYSHSIPSFVGPDFRGFAKLLGLGLVAIWVYAAQAGIAKKSLFVFAGALAMSTFNQGTAWDYNLTTTYPLLFLLFLEAVRTQRFGLLAFGMFAICGDRVWFTQKDAQVLTPSLHMTLELAFVVLVAMWIAREPSTEPVEVATGDARAA